MSEYDDIKNQTLDVSHEEQRNILKQQSYQKLQQILMIIERVVSTDDNQIIRERAIEHLTRWSKKTDLSQS